MTSAEIQVRNFELALLKPAVARAEDDKLDSPSRWIAAGWLIEVYSWMRLGVEIGYFDREKSAQLLTTHLVTFREAPRTASRDVGSLTRWFPKNVYYAWETLSVLNHEIYFPEYSQMPGMTVEANALFECSLLLAEDLFRNDAANYFLGRLNFSPPPEWESLLQKPIELQMLHPVPPTADPLGERRLLAGFLEFLEHLHSVGNLLTNIAPEAEREWLEGEIGLSTRWRLNLHSAREVERRFTRYQELFDEAVCLPSSKGEFVNVVAELTARWLGPGQDAEAITSSANAGS